MDVSFTNHTFSSQNLRWKLISTGLKKGTTLLLSKKSYDETLSSIASPLVAKCVMEIHT